MSIADINNALHRRPRNRPLPNNMRVLIMRCYLCFIIIIQQHKNNGTDQHNKNKAINKLELQLKGTVPGLMYIGVHSGGCDDDWRSVLESRNWTALRALDLCKVRDFFRTKFGQNLLS